MPDLGKMKVLTTRPNEMMAGIVSSILEDAGIESHTAVAGGVMANAEFGMSFVPTAIYVPEVDFEKAMAALENTREESIDLDWSEVDTGDDSPLTGQELDPSRYSRRGGWVMRTIWFVVAVVLLMLFL